MRRKVVFLIPASPNAGFMSQVAAFSLALSRLPWTRWQASTLVCFGEGMDRAECDAYLRWRPFLRDTIIVFAPENVVNEHYYNQIDGLYRWASHDADVLVRMDADTLPLGNLEDILDLVFERSAVAGTIAHYRFPAAPGVSNKDAWTQLAEEFDAPLRFDYHYSLAPPARNADEVVTPFYLNDGCVFFSRPYFERFRPLYLETRRALMSKLTAPYFSGQIALALSVARIDLPAIALPLRFNFPNDPMAAYRFPEEMSDLRLVHYLRTEEFDRQNVFADEAHYAAFMNKPLNPPNAHFRAAVRRLLGELYPFRAQADRWDDVSGHAGYFGAVRVNAK